jgi:hypothetical protein
VPVTLYRIKLYGHSGGDTELFCKNLATVLGIEEQRARTLMRDAPAIIKEGIEKAKAEEFCKLLEPIQALCIVEPLDGGVGEDVSIAALASQRPPESREADDLEKKAVRSRIWMVALVGAVGVLVLLVAVGFPSSFWSLYRHNQPPAPVEGPAATGTQSEPAPADAGPVSLEELLAQIDALEARIKSNRFRLAQAGEAQDMLRRSPRSQSKDLEELALTIRDLRNQIGRDAARLQALKRRVQEIE